MLAHIHLHTHAHTHTWDTSSATHTRREKADAHLQGHISHSEIFINQVSGQL